MQLRRLEGAAAPDATLHGADPLVSTVDGSDVAEATREGGTDGSLKARLARLSQQHLAEDRTKTWTLPGRDGLLRVRYRRLSRDETVRILFEPMKKPVSMVERNALLLIEACDEVYGQDGDQVEHLGDRDQPIGYTAELAEVLGVETSENRAVSVVREAVFLHVDEEMLAHAAEVYQWMSQLTASQEDALVGEA